MIRHTCAVFSLVAIATTASFAQGTSTTAAAAKPSDAKAEAIDQMVKLATGMARQTEPAPVKDPFGNVVAIQRFMAMYFIAGEHDKAPASDAGKLIDALLSRAEKQLGSTSPTSASTTIASKGLVPEILGVAVESGAINRDVKGTTFTFHITPMGVVKGLQRKGLLDIYTDYSRSAASHFASRFAMSASFDTSRGTAGTFTGEGNQLSAWSVRGKVIDGRDPANYASRWDALLESTASSNFQAAAAAVEAELGKWAEFTQWHQGLAAGAQKADQLFASTKDLAAAATAFRTVLDDEMPKLLTLPNRPPPVTKAIAGYTAALTVLQTDIDLIYDFAAKGSILTAEWVTTRDPSLPDLFTLNGIYEVGLGKARETDFTLNVSSSFYRSTPVGTAQAFKNFDLNAQLDHPLGKVLRAKSLLLTIAGRYSYLPNDTVTSTPAATTPTTAAPALKGHIGVLQFKFTLPVAKGVKIPLSITASNRTELIKEKDVRASFGFTFDLDAVLGIVTGK